jgi:tryptophan-rich sensory protein
MTSAETLHGMGTSGLYDWGAVALSVIAIALSAVYLWRVIEAYRMYHDERSAISLGKAMGLFVIAIGLTISASGLVLQESVLSVAGMTVARGALVVTMATLVLAHVRPGSDSA